MILDYNASRGTYILRVPAGEVETIQDLMRSQGFNFSNTASTPETAVLFTKEPYAAATYFSRGTERAKLSLKEMRNELEASWAPVGKRRYWSPPDREGLWPFQAADLDYALRRRNTLVADQPGLGKTPVAISFANEIKAKSVVVFCPANIRGQWATRIREWSRMSWDHGKRCIVHAITNGRRGVAATADYAASWNIVSYDLARTPAIGRALASEHFDLGIFDEAHYLKTADSKRARALLGGGNDPLFPALASRCDRLLALTGTPLPNRPREAYTIARAFNFDAIDWMSEDSFRERFNPSAMVEGVRKDGSSFRYIDERSGRHGELQNRLRANFMVRHLKREVMPQLKMPVFDLIQVEETGAVKQALAAERLLDIDPESLEGCDVTVLGHVAQVRHMMGVAMAPQIADYVEMLLDGGEEKLVLFAWHIEVMNILENRLQKYGVLRVDGGTSPSQKEARVREFVEDPTRRIIIGNVLSMGTGTDGLQLVSNHGLIAEPSWVSGENIQCFDRLDRGGQRRAVQGDIFVAPGSIAERVLAASLRKLAVTSAALDTQF